MAFKFDVIAHKHGHFLFGDVFEHFQSLVHHFIYFLLDFCAFTVDVFESVFDYVDGLGEILAFFVDVNIDFFEHFASF